MGKAQDQYKNKLSKAYRFKKKAGKVKKYKDNNIADKNSVKKARIIVRNLPFQASESDIRQLYEPFGKIEEINLLKRPDGKPVGCGFVQFENVEDASKAIFKTNKSNFLGRNISSEWAIPKSQFSENLSKRKVQDVKDEEIKEESDGEEPSTEEKNEKTSETGNNAKRKRKDFTKKSPTSKAEMRKLQKQRKRQKRSRIVIRNLPFAITEDVVKEHFSKYGNIEEIKLLKKPDGTPTGCGFLQFDRVQCAAQAIHYENMKPILNRPMVVDWALPKDKFEKSNKNTDIKEEGEGDEEITVVGEENNENFNKADIKIKEEKDSDDEIKEEDEVSEQSNNEDSDNEENSEDGEDNDSDNESLNDKKNVKLELDNKSITSSVAPHPRHFSNDVDEGKTVFIKNVPFSATNEELKECMQQFGPVYYALVCMDPLTEHSKGTAFVKFRNVEDAEKCLAAGTELTLRDQVLDPHKALHKNEVNKKNAEKKKKIKDSRNLYLVKEGVVLANSPAAEDVSAADMARRLQLEHWKSQMLRNLSTFVSRVRLVIQNLPESCDDTMLRQIVKKHSNPGAVITEVRVMRDLKNVDANGIGKSKQYGFVSFSKHEDAMKALRSLNNNPNVFTKNKRPIVAFSIENSVMVNAKQKRMERSRQRNPLWSGYKSSGEKPEASTARNDAWFGKKRFKKNQRPADDESRSAAAGADETESFAGVTSRPGITQMNGKYFLKKQASQVADNLKQRKKERKSLQRLKTIKSEQAANRKEAKPKQGSSKPDAEEANFSRLVNSYKNKLSSVSNFKSKWYET